jgi:histone acetyltransferase (RNA polymerase elongator complex component)
MKKNLRFTLYPLFTLFTLFISAKAKSQQVDSIYFHLYTDSIKKGVHNYINVDGKLNNGRWLPLSTKEIELSTTGGKFEGNDLVLPADFSAEKVTVKAVLKTNSAVWKEITIWVKKSANDESLLSGSNIVIPTPKTSSKKKRTRKKN